MHMNVKSALLRIHKTAGTSLAEGIRQHYPNNLVCGYQFEWQYLKAKPSEFQEFEFHYPHMGIGLAKRLLPEFYFFTILRDPRQRLISSYFYWRSLGRNVQEKQRGLHRRIINRGVGLQLHEVARKAAQLPIEEFLACGDPAIERAMNNVQARFLAGGRYGACAEFRTQLFGVEWSPSAIEEMALKGIEEFHVVGIAEEMADTTKVLERWLGKQLKVGLHNVTPEKYIDQEITDQAEYHIERLTQVDQQIYAAARKKLLESAAVPRKSKISKPKSELTVT